MSKHLKIMGLVKEFPFLKKLNRKFRPCERISVKRAGEQVMETIPVQTAIKSRLHDIDQGDDVYLFDEAGNLLGQVRPQRYTIDHTANGNETQTDGEALVDAVIRLGADQVHYAVWVEYGYQTLNHESTEHWKATVYKPHRELTAEEIAAATWQDAIKEAELFASV